MGSERLSRENLPNVEDAERRNTAAKIASLELGVTVIGSGVALATRKERAPHMPLALMVHATTHMTLPLQRDKL